MSPLEWLASQKTPAAGAAVTGGKSDAGLPRDKGKPGGLTRPANHGSISDRYAEDPTAFAVVKDWKDGLMAHSTLMRGPDGVLSRDFDPKTGVVWNSWYKTPIPPEVLKIIPNPNWHKLMTNYDGTPIIYDKPSTYPKQPDHPFYHMMIVHGGSESITKYPSKFDPLRTHLLKLLGIKLGSNRAGYK